MRRISRISISLVVLTAALAVGRARAAETALISYNAGGTDSGNSYSGVDSFRDLPGQDRYVVFSSAATDITDDPDPTGSGGAFLHDTPFGTNVFVRDMSLDTTELVSISEDGTTTGNGPSNAMEVSIDGRFVAFPSSATNLVTVPDANGAADGFVRDLLLGTTALLTLNGAGTGTLRHPQH